MTSHRRLVRRFSRKNTAYRALIQGLAVSLIEHGRIKTTVAKAKETRRFVERLVTLAKKQNLHSYRLVVARLRGHKAAAQKLFKELAPQYAQRPGGYTRIIKLGPRPGDRAEMALLEFVS